LLDCLPPSPQKGIAFRKQRLSQLSLAVFLFLLESSVYRLSVPSFLISHDPFRERCSQRSTSSPCNAKGEASRARADPSGPSSVFAMLVQQDLLFSEGNPQPVPRHIGFGENVNRSTVVRVAPDFHPKECLESERFASRFCGEKPLRKNDKSAPSLKQWDCSSISTC
jgi:hypothetical protein